ncbi:MAG: hypothetical protein AAGG02_10545 [Cyanobacteria bacterium P01_H01_bin.15]
MISVVINFWNAICRVGYLIDKYSAVEIVDEIIIVDPSGAVGSEYDLQSSNKSIQVISARNDPGLLFRLSAALMANNECVLHVDDDIEVLPETIRHLYESWQEAPSLCHGVFGRSIIQGKYDKEDQFGDVDIVLTRCCMSHRANNAIALWLANKIPVRHSVPEGNGEDIILSYAARANSGELNRAYPLMVKELIRYESREANRQIHRRWKGHWEHRTWMAQACQLIIKNKNDIERFWPLA